MNTQGALALALAAVTAVAGAAYAEPVWTVVIDAGHGGSNIGAPGPNGTTEKRVTLAIARQLRRELEGRGMKVVLTRDHDVYLTLGERVRRANGAGADLFLSIHANASPEHQRRGVETFVAAREIADVAADRAASSVSDPGTAMIARARARYITAESSRLARAVQSTLGAARAGDRGVRQAPYDVLDGVHVPAALVEVGFIDHAEEGVEIVAPETQAQIAAALADGIVAFLERTDGAIARR